MEDSVYIRAIFIGASLILILAIFTMVMNYYTKAKEEVGDNILMEIETMYQANIEAAISAVVTENALLDAVQVKNMINYYYGSYKVLINLLNVKLLKDGYISDFKNANNNSNDIIVKDSFSKESYKKVNFNIDPNQKYELQIKESNGVITYTLTGK